MQFRNMFMPQHIISKLKNLSLLLLFGVTVFAYAGPAVHPYWDQGGMTGLTLSNLNTGSPTEADGGVYPVIAFVNARDASCTAGLASASTTGPYNPLNFYALSFGGAIGTYVTDCVVIKNGHGNIEDADIFSNPSYIDQDAQQVAASIVKYFTKSTPPVFTAVPTRLDFDVENSAETGYMDVVRFRALYWLQKGFQQFPGIPSLKVTFTLPVLPTGLVASETGELFLKHLNDYLNYFSSTDDGSWFDGINLMTMDYGPGGSCTPASTTLPPNKASWFDCGSSTFADTVVQAATNTYTQVQNVPLTTFPSETNKLKLLFSPGSAKMSVTPMIGQNDTADEQFYLSQATLLSDAWQSVTAFPAGDIRYWSMNRDQACTAPFPVGSASSGCSAQYQSSSFSQSNPRSDFFQGMRGTKTFPVVSGATLSGTPTIAVTQYQTADSKYTPYYTATITPPASSSGEGYYMVVAAQPTGLDPDYTAYVDVLKSIDGCSPISGAHPQTGYSTIYSPVQFVSNTSPAAFTVFTPPDVVVASSPVLCPFEDYTFTYYTMAENGDWSSTGQSFSGAPAGTGKPTNQITRGYSGPAGAYNTVAGQSSGVYLAVNAIPDWGLIQGQVKIGSSDPVNLTVGNYLYFYPTPTAGTSVTISASYPPESTVSPLRTFSFPTVPAGTSASANTILLSVFSGVNQYDSNIGFVGAGTNFTPAGAQLSSAAVLGDMLSLKWGHISTTLANTIGAPTYSLTVYPDGSTTPAYGPVTVSDNTSSDFNSYVIPSGALTSGTKYNYTIQVNNPSSSNGLNLQFTNGGAFTGSFTLPVDISSSFTNTVSSGSLTPSAQGFGLESSLLALKNVRFMNDTGITFSTPFTESVYGATQFAQHDCGNPANNSTNGVKPATTVITYGQRTYYPTLSTDQDPTSVYYVGTDNQPYCQTTVFYDVPYGVNSIAAGATWDINFSVTAADASIPSDVTNAVNKMQSSELVFQPYGSNKTYCQLNFLNIPNDNSQFWNWGSGALPAGSLSVNIIDPTGIGTWQLQWNPGDQSTTCSLPNMIGSDGTNFSSATATSAQVTAGVTNISKSLPSISVVSQITSKYPSGCTGQTLYNLLTSGKFFSIWLSNTTNPGNRTVCTVTQAYASSH